MSPFGILRRSTPALGLYKSSRVAARWQSTYSHLEPEMTKRKIRPIFDDLTPQYSYRLETSLADFIPGTK